MKSHPLSQVKVVGVVHLFNTFYKITGNKKNVLIALMLVFTYDMCKYWIKQSLYPPSDAALSVKEIKYTQTLMHMYVVFTSIQ